MNVDSPADRAEFERLCLEIASTLATLRSDPFDLRSPSFMAAELRRIDKALTRCLQVLLPLQLQHEVGQDLLSKPFNWPLQSELASARVTAEIMRVKGPPAADFERANYPTQLLDDMVQMRDAARFALTTVNPKRGNDPRRTVRTAAIEVVAKNFVFRYRATFGHFPPVSQSGWEVDLLGNMLGRVGIDDADPADVLRRAVEKDPMRAHLPGAKDVRTASNTQNRSNLSRRPKRQ